MQRDISYALQQSCHPDRSEAQWRDLLFISRFSLKPCPFTITFSLRFDDLSHIT
jgi:hypothetical protein